MHSRKYFKDKTDFQNLCGKQASYADKTKKSYFHQILKQYEQYSELYNLKSEQCNLQTSSHHINFTDYGLVSTLKPYAFLAHQFTRLSFLQSFFFPLESFFYSYSSWKFNYYSCFVDLQQCAAVFASFQTMLVLCLLVCKFKWCQKVMLLFCDHKINWICQKQSDLCLQFK